MTATAVATMHEEMHYDAAKQQGSDQTIACEDVNAVLETE